MQLLSRMRQGVRSKIILEPFIEDAEQLLDRDVAMRLSDQRLLRLGERA